jgi:hypothetical protein
VPEYIDMTPTWSALVSSMLVAHANMTRQIANAAFCDGREDGWCSVHDSTYDEPIFSDSKCHVNSNEDAFYEWREGVVKALSNLNGEFRRMAEAADRYNDIVKAEEAEALEGHDEDAVNGIKEQREYEESIEREIERRNRDYDDGIIHEDDI